MTQQTQDNQKTAAAVLDPVPVPDTPAPPPAASTDPAAPPPGGPPAPNAPKAAAKKRKAKKRVRRIIALVVTLALLAGASWAIWYFIFRDTVEQGELLKDEAQISTIQSKVEGSGNARAGKTAAINLTSPGTVQDVFVAQGDTVNEGDILYSIYSPTAEDKVTDAKKGVRTAEEEVTSAEDGVVSAQEGILTAQEGVTEAHEAVKQAQSAVKDAQNAVKDAEDAVKDAQNAQAERQKELADLQSSLSDLSVTAPFAGKLISVENIRPGDKLGAEAAVATLVNDKIMSLSLYFSYAYVDGIQVGQSAEVSVPSMSLTCKGTVTEIHRINKVSPEGAILFEAVIAVVNPGAMSEDMEATASLRAGDGSSIFPYDTGKLAYSQTEKLATRFSGPVTAVDLLQFADVAQGQVLLTQGSDDLDEQIKAKQKEVEAAQKGVETAEKGVETAKKGVESAQKGVAAAEKGVTAAEKAVTNAQREVGRAEQRVLDAQQGVLDAQEKVAEAEKALEDLNAVAPISGTITSCTINPGDEVQSGDTVITISDTSQMVVEIKVTDQNIGFITPGMMVELKDWNDNMWMGAVTKIDMNPSQDDMGSGVTKYPVTLTVDNYDGTLTNGMPLNYSFVASQVEDCLIVPNQAVKSAMDEEGNEITVVFIEAESRPDNAVTMPEQSPDMPKKYPTEEDGFYAVPVTTGLNDTYNVEIRSGLNVGDVVFTNYLSASGDNWGMMYG